MPALSEPSFKQRIDYIKDDLAKDKPVLINQLNEKGVECSLLIPLLEIFLGFDAVKDIKYEFTSDKRFERFDCLIEDRFIVEAKKLNSPLGGHIADQIQKYISHHDQIKYGILSNGSHFAFFIQKAFVKEFLGPEETLKINFDKEVFHILTISIFDEYFFEVIKLFSKDIYHETFSQLAKFTLTRINQSRATKIIDDKNLNTWLQNKIIETMDIQHGAYLSDIQNNKIQPGQELVFDNGDVRIKVTVLNDGRVKLKKGEAVIKDMMKVMDNEFCPMIDLVRNELRNEDYVFSSTDEVIRMVTGRERLRKGKYDFK